MNFLLKLFTIYLVFGIEFYVSGKTHHQFHRFKKNDETIENAPYMVSIRLNHKDSRSFGAGQICSGTLISQDTILSAASCLYHNNHLVEAKHIRIVAGSSLQSEFTAATYLARLTHYTIHDKFNSTSLENNLALLYISVPIDKDNPRISPIKYSKYSLEYEAHCETKGWVKLLGSKNKKYAKRLQAASVTVLDATNDGNCDQQKRPNNLCTVIQDNISCGLDVGSPLICNDMIYGMMDRQLTENCTSDSGSYLDISLYAKWIELNRNRSARANCDIFLIVILIVVKFLI